MADDNKHQDNDKNAKRGGEFRLQPRTWLVWVIIIGGIVLLVTMKDRLDVPRAPLSQYEFFQKVDSNLVASASINYGAQSALTEIVGSYYRTTADGSKV